MLTVFFPVDPAGIRGLPDQLDILLHRGVVKDQVLHQPLPWDPFGVLDKFARRPFRFTVDHAFDRHGGHQPFALHAAFPLLEVVPVEGEEFVPLHQMFVAPLAQVQPGSESVHDDVPTRGVHQLANQPNVVSCYLEQPELKPHILHRPVGVAPGKLDRGRMPKNLGKSLQIGQVRHMEIGAVLERIREILLQPLGCLAQVAEQAVELGEIPVDHLPVGSLRGRNRLSTAKAVSGRAFSHTNLVGKVSRMKDLCNRVCPIWFFRDSAPWGNPQVDDGFNVRLDGGVEVNGLLADLLGVQETVERLGHEKVVVIGRDFANVIVDVVTPPFRFAGGLVLGQGAIRHGFAECVVGGHPDDGQHDESRHAAYRPLEQEPLNGIANPARDEPAHHMVQR